MSEVERSRLYQIVLGRYRALQTISGVPLFQPDPHAHLRSFGGVCVRYVRYAIVDRRDKETVIPPLCVVAGTPIILDHRISWYPVDACSVAGRVGWSSPGDPPYPPRPVCLSREPLFGGSMFRTDYTYCGLGSRAPGW